MQIIVKDEALQEIAQAQVEKAMRDGLGNYEVTKALRDAVISAVDVQSVGSSVDEAMKSLDWPEIQARLAATFTEMVHVSVKALMSRAVVDVLMSMEGIPSYEHDKQSVRRAEIEVELGFRAPDSKPEPAEGSADLLI